MGYKLPNRALVYYRFGLYGVLSACRFYNFLFHISSRCRNIKCCKKKHIYTMWIKNAKKKRNNNTTNFYFYLKQKRTGIMRGRHEEAYTEAEREGEMRRMPSPLTLWMGSTCRKNLVKYCCDEDFVSFFLFEIEKDAEKCWMESRFIY